MSDPFRIEILDPNFNLGWDLNQMLISLSESDWHYVTAYQNNSYVCNLELFPDKLDQLYQYMIDLQNHYRQLSNLTPAQTVFINSTFNKSKMDLYRTHTETDGMPIYNNISKYAIAIGLRNTDKYAIEFAPTYPTDPSINSNDIVPENFESYPKVREILDDNKTYIFNRSMALRGKTLNLPPVYRYLIVFFLI